MTFDVGQITAPFRMQPGLQRLDPAARHLTPLDSRSALAHEKQQVLHAGQSRLCVPGFDPAPAIAAVWARARAEMGDAAPSNATPLELAFEEDLAILDGTTASVPWLCVCTPSHWAPEDKLGLSLAAIHAPVADAAALQAATQALVRLVTAGGHWERHVWTLTSTGRYDQHPWRHPRQPWPQPADAEAFAAQCFLRDERQTFLPVPGQAQAIFTIRVRLQPLAQAVRTPEQAGRLHDALASMSGAVLDYKDLRAAQGPLLKWLAARAG